MQFSVGWDSIFGSLTVIVDTIFLAVRAHSLSKNNYVHLQISSAGFQVFFLSLCLKLDSLIYNRSDLGFMLPSIWWLHTSIHFLWASHQKVFEAAPGLCRKEMFLIQLIIIIINILVGTIMWIFSHNSHQRKDECAFSPASSPGRELLVDLIWTGRPAGQARAW